MGYNGVGFMHRRFALRHCAAASDRKIRKAEREIKMPLQVECVVDSGVYAEESLGGAR